MQSAAKPLEAQGAQIANTTLLCTGAARKNVNLRGIQTLLKHRREPVALLLGNEHVLVHFYSSRTLRRLVLSSADDGAEAARAFVGKLWSVFDGSVPLYLNTHAEKVRCKLLG